MSVFWIVRPNYEGREMRCEFWFLWEQVNCPVLIVTVSDCIRDHNSTNCLDLGGGGQWKTGMCGKISQLLEITPSCIGGINLTRER